MKVNLYQLNHIMGDKTVGRISEKYKYETTPYSNEGAVVYGDK